MITVNALTLFDIIWPLSASFSFISSFQWIRANRCPIKLQSGYLIGIKAPLLAVINPIALFQHNIVILSYSLLMSSTLGSIVACSV